ncbi:phosphatase PAP2 family protein [Paraburkholderia sp. HD33-4]|uniref:phosphatase PAP2 family protein n=1 Tax=Paraburkholderia sp. HD33-4 TaxID=2883242 RepID=UPI001F446F28|nr:phosphatase PAP2 family protein [Paraburkholderia sp. HD33-4]
MFEEIQMESTDSGFRDALKRCGAAAMTALVVSGAHAGGIDHEVAYDNSGIWNRNVQLALEYSVIATGLAGAFWLGNDNELGHTFWQTLDASAISAVAAQGMKYAFGRQRPSAGKGPNQWFSGGDSFPSGEVTLQASFVTPFIVNYARHDPWVWSLELLPLYDSIARVKSQAHWQTDVLAGWALGTAVGYLSTRWQTPLFVQILPHSFTVGFSKRF